MKFNKLLFFLFALVSLNSCVEYVDNGSKTDGQEPAEQQNFVAKQSNADTATKVKEIFEFEGKFNNVDVTSSTKFKVNGVDIKGNTYTPFKEGSHSVLATYLNFTSTFKFTVLPADEEPEPEPTGNRIEYGGKSYPVSSTQWIIHVEDNKIVTFNRNGVTCTLWALMSLELDVDEKVVNQFLTFAYVPLQADGKLAYPNNSPGTLEHVNGGLVVINKTEVFKTAAATYNFEATGNTTPQNGASFPLSGTGNYTALATASGSSAELFWNGPWDGFGSSLISKAKMGNIMNNFNGSQINNLKDLNTVKNLKIAK